MNVCYIKEMESSSEILKNKNSTLPNVIKRIIYLYKVIFNIPKVELYENCFIYTIPYIKKVDSKKEKEIFSRKIKQKLDENNYTKIIICILKFILELTDIRVKRITKKIIQKLEKYNINTICISSYLQDIEYLKNNVYSNDINILNGRWLFKILTNNVLEYIDNYSNMDIKSEEIAILINDNRDINIDNIISLTSQIKKIKIVTNNVERFRLLEERLYDKLGIAVSVSSNKKKSLAKTNIIINMDFPEELLNEYTINKNAIIINLEDKIQINSKRFSGININYYEIRLGEDKVELLKDYGLYNKFDTSIIYESLIYKKDNLNNLKEKIKKDDVQIINLIGNNGKINVNEFKDIKQ